MGLLKHEVQIIKSTEIKKAKQKPLFSLLIFASLLLVSGCSVKQAERVELKNSDGAVVGSLEPKAAKELFAATAPKINDSAALLNAISLSSNYYQKEAVKNGGFALNGKNYAAKDTLVALKTFGEAVEQNFSNEKLTQKIDELFELYQSQNSRGNALVTGYYAPVLKASLQNKEGFTSPLYTKPKGLLTAELGDFDAKLKGKKLLGRVDGERFVPYYSLAQIYSGALKDEEPIAYLQSDIDALFLHIQGSGVLEFEDGNRTYINYQAQNGREYISIGKLLLSDGSLKEGNVTMQSIRQFLAAHPDRLKKLLSELKSFVFFTLGGRPPTGNINLPLTPKVSVAMDSALMPKGALCYIKTKLPKLPPDGNLSSIASKSQREELEGFFVVQDTGGAIKGGGRVDIYMGEGEQAAYYAGQMAEEAEVYIFLPKKSLDQTAQ